MLKDLGKVAKPYFPKIIVGFLALLFGAGLNFPLPLVTKNLINSIKTSSLFFNYVLLFVLIVLLKEVFLFISYYVFEVTVREYVASLRVLIYETFQSYFEYFAFYESGRIFTYINQDPERVRDFLYPTFIYFLKDFLTFSFAFGVGIYINAPVTSLSLIPLLIFFLVISRINPIIRNLSANSIESYTEFVTRLKEFVGTMEIFRVSLKERFSVKIFSEFNKKFLKSDVERIKAIILSNFPLSLLFQSGYVVAIISGVYFIRIHVMGFGSLVAILMIVNQMYEASKSFWDLNVHLEEIKVVSDRLSKVFSIKNKLDRPARRVASINTIEVSIPDFKFKGEKSILRNLQFTAKKGEILGIIGKSGQGKSTLIRIILGLLGRDEKYIRVNGIYLKNISLSSFFRKIGYVPQKPIVFKGTVKENIFLGDKEVELSKTLLEVLDDLSLDKFVEEGGRNLSGGEIQRINLARAFVSRGKELYLLDEPIAHLDIYRAEKVKELLISQSHNAIILVISHLTEWLEGFVHRTIEIT